MCNFMGDPPPYLKMTNQNVSLDCNIIHVSSTKVLTEDTLRLLMETGLRRPGGTPENFLVGVRRPVIQILTFFSNNYDDGNENVS